MRGQKRAKAGNKGSGNHLPKKKGGGLPKREEGGKWWRQGWRKKGGKWKQGNNNKGGDRQRNTKITIQLQNPELFNGLNRKTFLEGFGRLEDELKERLTEFKVKLMGSNPSEPGFY